jgi:hypothetical protein
MMTRLRQIAPRERLGSPTLRWTLDGDAGVEARIGADQRLIAQAVLKTVPAAQLVALVLMGGYGRGEGGFVETPDGPAPYNDYDYFVIVRNCGGAARAALRGALATLGAALQEQVGVEVDLELLPADRLERAEPSLVFAEMHWGHRVLAGEPRVLNAMPRMAFHRLPPGEITRLMLNRGALLLMNQQRLAERPPGEPAAEALHAERPELLKHVCKAVLACGDARLAAAGMYHPSYPEKLRRLESLQAPASGPASVLASVPGSAPTFAPAFAPARSSATDHAAFLELYRIAYAQKFRPDYAALGDAPVAQWQDRAVSLWAETLRTFETARLGRTVRDWHAYCRTFPAKGQRSRLSRNLGVTLRDFGPLELMRRPARAMRYPRERLIGALPLLLTEPGDGASLRCAARALGLPGRSERQRLTQRFLDLWSRYA